MSEGIWSSCIHLYIYMHVCMYMCMLECDTVVCSYAYILCLLLGLCSSKKLISGATYVVCKRKYVTGYTS